MFGVCWSRKVARGDDGDHMLPGEERPPVLLSDAELNKVYIYNLKQTEISPHNQIDNISLRDANLLYI